jgi:hypothetical protein
MAFVFASASVLIKGSLSTMSPVEFESSCRRVSSNYLRVALFSDVSLINCFHNHSKSGFSNPTTTFKSWSANPCRVTLKLIIIVLPKTSGGYDGFANLVVKKSLKFSSQSTYVSPSLMYF